MHHKTIKPLLLAAIAAILMAPGARAAGTAAGTTISNQATVNYEVNNISQTAVTSNNYEFVVDRKINLAVATTDGAPVAVTPGSADSALSFTVQNTGNGSQDFALSATARAGGAGAFGGTDDADAQSVATYLESGATPGYQSGEDTATHIDALAADGSSTVYIVGDFSSGAYSDGEIASYHLLVESRINDGAGTLGGALSETAGADTVGSEDVVFADAQGSDTGNDAVGDAKFSGDSDFEISAASLSLSKSSAVISDPTNGTTNPKAIPGAVIEYTITISNAADATTATNISFSDSLNTEIVAGTLVFDPNTYAPAEGIEVTAPNINSGSPQSLSNASDGDEGDWNATGANTVTVSGIELAASEEATITFRVTVQ